MTGLFYCLAVVSVGLLTGCDGQPGTAVDSEVHDHEAMSQDTSTTEMDTEQTTCPVMGGPINKAYYTEYQGKRVYFCCPSCDEEFAKDPEKYIKDLPQFN